MAQPSRSAVVRHATTAAATEALHGVRRGFRSPEAVLGMSSDRFDDPIVQWLWIRAVRSSRAKGRQPDRAEFLRTLPEWVEQRLRDRLGPHGFAWATSTDVGTLVTAYRAAIDNVQDAPWHFVLGPRSAEVMRRLTPHQRSALRRELVRKGLPLPVDMAVKSGQLPSWDVARSRAWKMFSLHAINMGRNSPVSLGPMDRMFGDGAGKIPFDQLWTPIADIGGVPLGLTIRDAAGAASGRAPVAWGGIDRATGSVRPPPRVDYEVRLQLMCALKDPRFARAGIDSLDDLVDPSRLRAADALIASRAPANPRNPFAELSATDCLKILRQDPDAPKILYASMELEHHLGQRTGTALERVIRELNLDARSADNLRLLSGRSDPNNIMIVTPLEHLGLDVFAAAVPGLMAKGVFAHNLRRLGRLIGSDGKRIIDPRVGHIESDAFEVILREAEGRPGFSMIAGGSSHPDAKRAANKYRGAEQWLAHDLLSAFTGPEMARAALAKGPNAANYRTELGSLIEVAIEYRLSPQLITRAIEIQLRLGR